MAAPSLLLPGTVLAIVFLLCTYLVKGRRNPASFQLLLHRRQFSGAKKSSQPVASEKVISILAPDSSDVYPPPRKIVLASIPGFTGKLDQDQSTVEVSAEKEDVPLTTELHDAKKTMCTPCEFTVREIDALGDFPDYALLSGVPLPKPYFDFNITKAKARPYRPFRWAYHQTMSLTKMEPDWWIELDDTYEERILQRQEIWKKESEGVMNMLPGSYFACKELMEVTIQFLCARYPQYFRLDKEKMVFYNTILNTESDLKRTHPLHVVFNNVPEDFAIMMRNPTDGIYSFRAGTICSSLGWNVGTKIGKTLPEIHAPVPDYKERMQLSMDRYFTKMPTDKPIQRGSWGLEVDQPLYIPPGDPHEKLRNFQMADLDISRCNLRVDWQTLRRLPLSGAIVFNFKALFTPLEELRTEPFVPALVLKVLNESKSKMMEYKNTWHTEHVAKPALEEWSKEQVKKGWVPQGWEPRTLDESPFFPGWEEKWRRQNGF